MSPASPREARAAAATFAALCTALFGLLLLAPMRDVVLRFMHDDAFYYFGIARRWNRLGFPTFDGITATNGYHPLWQWVLLAASPRFPDPTTFVRAGAASGVVCLGLAAWLIARRLAWEDNPHRSLAYAWVAGALLFATIYGMESPFAAALLAAAISAAPRGTVEWTPPRALACGVATALLFLARIDALIWLAALDAVLAMAAWNGNRRLLRLIALVIGVQAVVVGGYFLSNWINWDHLLTISAAVKAARAPTLSLTVPRSVLLFLATAVTALGTAPLMEFSTAWLRRQRGVAWPLVTPAWLALANLAYLATIVAKGNRETYNWYFVLTVLSGAYLLPVCLERYGTGWLKIPERPLKLSGVALCALLLAQSVYSKITQPNGFLVQYDQAAVLATFPEDSLVLAANDCGILGYFSRQHVINLDGLTNSWGFQTALADDRLGPWLIDLGFNAYVTPASAAIEGGTVALETRAGLRSPPRTLRLRVEPMPGAPRLASGIGVWRVVEVGPAP
ncbi:MAG TPA: hypothetical protein VN654_09605 [Vicinamibacterales bacterium]|nr:hypothetical protein [Vicinamibacterales bacterium]